jgi:DNA primase
LLPTLEQRIDEAKRRVRIEDLVARDFELRKVGKEFVSVQHDSLHVNPDKQKWFWHSRDLYGDSIAWLMKIHELPFYDALDELAGRLPASIPVTRTLVQREESRKAPLSMALVERYHADLLANSGALTRLCDERHMTLEQVAEHRLGYKRDHWGLGETFVIPVLRRTASGDEVLTIRHRLFTPPNDGSSRYRPERAGDKAHLFGWDYVTDNVVIVEGEFKAMTLQNHGAPACAIMGVGSFTDAFDDEFIQRAKRAVVAMDDGIDPRKLGWCNRLRAKGVDLRVAQMPGKPDDLINAGQMNTVFSAIANAVRLK